MAKTTRKGRAAFKGDKLIPIDIDKIIGALEQKQSELGVSQADLMKQVGLPATFLSILRQRKQGTVFSKTLVKLSDYLKIAPEQLTRTPQSVVAFSASLPPSSSETIIERTIRYGEFLRSLPPDIRQQSQQLLSYILTH